MSKSSSSPRKAQWGMQQTRQRRDPSPSGAQWDASITLRAVQSESLQIRNSSNIQKYPPSPTSTTFQSSSSSSLNNTMSPNNSSRSVGSSNRTTMSNVTTDSIGQQQIEQRGRQGFNKASNNTNNFHSYSLSVDTAKAQQQYYKQHETALGLFRSIEATSPTSTNGSQYHYWRGGDSPALMKGSEPPFHYAERRPSWTLENNYSSTQRGAPLLSPKSTSFDNHHLKHRKAESQGNPLHNIQMIEQEAKALMLLRSESSQKNEKHASVKPLRVSSKSQSNQAERVRFDDSHPNPKRSLDVEQPVRPSFFKKAFGSPQKKVEKETKTERPIRSSIRNSHSSSSLRHQKGKQRETLTRMISAPTLIETSSTASPVLEQQISSFPERQKSEVVIQPKRRKRAPPPPPPRRKQSESSNITQSTRSPISPLSPITPPDQNDQEPAITDYIDGKHSRKESNSTIKKNETIHLSEDFSLIGHMPLDFINGIGKERKLSNTESLGSIYDQESWTGHTPQQENDLSLPSPIYHQQSKLRNGVGRKKSEISPLVKDHIVELQEPETSIDHSVDASNTSSHLIYLEEIHAKENKRGTIYEDADSGLASNEEYIGDDYQSPIIGIKRRPSSPKYYKIVRTTDEDSNELEYLDSIHLYDEEEECQTESSIDNNSTSSIQRTNSSLTTAEQEEIDKFVKNYGKNIHSVRASTLMEFDDSNERSNFIEKVWQERRQGKRNVISFILATISGTMTYLTPIKFKDIHQIRNYNIESHHDQLEQFHMESLKDNCERLFLASIPMYETIFVHAWNISHWTNKSQSLAWCLTYFTSWYFDAVIPAALAIIIFKIVNEKKYGKQRGSILSSKELQSRSQLLKQFSEGIQTQSNGSHSSISSSPTLAGDEKSFSNTESDVSAALRKHTQTISNFIAKIADIHERMYNMSRWSHTPATIRTLIIIGITLTITLFFNASQILYCFEFIFGVFFFVVVPILSQFESSIGKYSISLFSIFDFILSGVPNDAQNALLIMRKSDRNSAQQQEEQQTKRQGIAKFDSDDDDDDVIIQPPHARGKRDQTKEESQPKCTWAAKETTFTATYDDKNGLLIISSKRLLFRTGGPSFIVLLDFSLEQIVQIDKVRTQTNQNDIQNEGLRFTIKQDQSIQTSDSTTFSMHTFLNMNLRDEAFNRVLALAPQRWHKQAGINTST